MKPSVANATTSEPNGYEVYGTLLSSELSAQDARKASFEQRAVWVVTTSGTLVTLLLALAALSAKHARTLTLPPAGSPWLTAALGCFFLSALSAFVANLPLRYETVTAEAIEERLLKDPPLSFNWATKDVALTRVKALKSAKFKNTVKGWALAAAIGFESLAVGFVVIAVSLILYG